MSSEVSPNTQAILLLTAPLLIGKKQGAAPLLAPGEYKRLAARLLELHRQPADLLAHDADGCLHACSSVADERRLRELLGRGFALSQAIEHWHARAIWVVSRADPEYPARLKRRLQGDAPAVLYGCGEHGLPGGGGLAVVGSRGIDENLLDYTMKVGALAARAQRSIVSGGARGVDSAAMRGALEGGGTAVGIMADSLERAVMNRELRDMIVGGRLTLVSPYDPRAGFNVGNAMQRNKLIYALADAALVVNSDMGKGGTWAGAVEQLDKLHLVPVYVRSTGNQPPAFAALQKKGALPWPNPADAEALERVLAEPRHAATPMSETQKNLFSESNHAGRTDTAIDADRDSSDANRYGVAEASRMHLVEEPAPNATSHSVAPNNVPVETPEADGAVAATATPADLVFNGARVAVRELLSAPMQAPDIAKALDVSPAQANAWLKRLVEEGSIERLRKPVRYVVKSRDLF